MKQIFRVDYAKDSQERIGLGLVFLLFLWCLIMSFTLSSKKKEATVRGDRTEYVQSAHLVGYQ